MSSFHIRRAFARFVFLMLAGVGAAEAQSPPSADISFSPSTIITGETSTLAVALYGGSGGVSNVSLNLTYDPGVTNTGGAIPHTCGAATATAVSSPSEGLLVTGITLAPDQSCTVFPPVTGTPGMHTTTLQPGNFGGLNGNASSASLGVSARPFVVTNTSGSTADPGSLPDIIEQVNNSCTPGSPQSISFSLPVGTAVIQPLAQMTLYCPGTTIDATTAVASIVIDGSACTGARAGGCSGFLVESNDATIRGIEITKFAAAGIEVDYLNLSIARNDIHGNGIGVLVGGGGEAFIGNSDESNGISGNTGSGIVVKGQAEIIGNSILDNGGTGIEARGNSARIASNTVQGNADGILYAFAIACDCAVSPVGFEPLRARAAAGRSKVFFGSSNEVAFNTITRNRGAGIVLLNGREVIIGENSIYDNGGIGIDIDGDGVSSQGTTSLDYPEIRSVRYVGSDTVIDGALKTSSSAVGAIHLYQTSDPRAVPEGEQHVAQVDNPVFNATAGEFQFSVTVLGKLLNNVTAMASMDTCGDACYATSEFSPKFAVMVPPTLTVSPPSLNFGTVVVGTTSPPLTLTLANGSSTTALSLSPIIPGGDFSVASTTCGAVLAAASSCTANLVFTPTAVGARDLTFTIASDASNGPQPVVLMGTGAAPGASLATSPSSLTFAAQDIGTASTPQAFTLSNTGSLPVSIVSITASGDFAVLSGCPASLSKGASCTVDVKFVPTAAGARSGAVNIVASDGNYAVALSGTGTVAPVAGISVSPTSLAFGTRTLGTTSSAQGITVTNSGTAPLAISGIATSGDFSSISACPATLAVGASCSIAVKFTPLVTGARSGTLSITTNAPGSPTTIALSGTGVDIPVGTLDISPGALDFLTQPINVPSGIQLVNVTNVGGATVFLRDVTLTGDFSVVDPPAGSTACGGALAPGATCAFALVFTPTAAGPREGLFTIRSDGTNFSADVLLAGYGEQGAAQRALQLPAALAFPPQPFGTASSAQALQVSNNSAGPVVVRDIAASGDFSVVENCTIIPAGGSCTVMVTFLPTARGDRSGTLTVRIASESQPYLVTLSGLGIANSVPILSVAPTFVAYGNTFVGSVSDAAAIVLTNVGEAELRLDGITAPGDFTMDSHCHDTLAAGASCTVDVRFFPRMLDARGGSLEIRSNAAGSPHFVALSGTGCSIPNVGRSRIPQLLCGP